MKSLIITLSLFSTAFAGSFWECFPGCTTDSDCGNGLLCSATHLSDLNARGMNNLADCDFVTETDSRLCFHSSLLDVETTNNPTVSPTPAPTLPPVQVNCHVPACGWGDIWDLATQQCVRNTNRFASGPTSTVRCPSGAYKITGRNTGIGAIDCECSCNKPKDRCLNTCTATC